MVGGTMDMVTPPSLAWDENICREREGNSEDKGEDEGEDNRKGKSEGVISAPKRGERAPTLVLISTGSYRNAKSDASTASLEVIMAIAATAMAVLTVRQQ